MSNSNIGSIKNSKLTLKLSIKHQVTKLTALLPNATLNHLRENMSGSVDPIKGPENSFPPASPNRPPYRTLPEAFQCNDIIKAITNIVSKRKIN